MHLLKRLAALLSLVALLGLAACSGLTLAYQQLPLLAGLWADHYLDLDRSQRARLNAQLVAWQAWHRREELPQWLALLQQADAALDGGVTAEELLALERGARASVERSLRQAAPLAVPLLASLRPEQWQHLGHKLEENTAEWREQHAGDEGPRENARRYLSSLERWLGDLDRPTRRQAREDALAWHVDFETLAQGRVTRQARTVDALRAWSRHELAAGMALLAQNLLPLPAELAYREEIIASLLKLLNGLNAEQRAEVRQHWAGWAQDLRGLQSAGP